MALLELKNIGKIYVSENTIAVGIRGVNLSFDRGEFVAITGQSGSGKSTLLNVISGMDSYEEGEMYIEGEDTSPYIQADWERYREKYISFIFQEYNIIDSFTVLENVELSLLHIQDPKERRARAMELLKRVGMEKHIRHKGSHLSGGQKQRTVIARALAKDSPIILADEPTGNLDSTTSKEIIELLKEVSKDKLLIVVTHNYEEVADYATREIRVYDGAVASDRQTGVTEEVIEDNRKETSQEKEQKHPTFRNSMALGISIFKSKPKLTIFMSLLIAVASVAIFFSFAAFWADAKVIFVRENFMFKNVPGRVVIVRKDGGEITDEEVEKLKIETNAKDTLHVDYGLDNAALKDWKKYYSYLDEYGNSLSNVVSYIYGKDYGKLDIGRYPEKDTEVVLSVPYFLRHFFGEDEASVKKNTPKISTGVVDFDVVGIHYYLDSQIQGEFLFTKEGYEKATAVKYLYDNYEYNVKLSIDEIAGFPIDDFMFNTKVPEGLIYYKNTDYDEMFEYMHLFFYQRRSYNDTEELFKQSLDFLKPEYNVDFMYNNIYYNLFINPASFAKPIMNYLNTHYKQASLFYSSGSQAKKAVTKLDQLGYIAITADTTYQIISMTEYIDIIVLGVLYLVLWFLITVFLAFFIRLCTKKSMDAFKPDIAIMRSMGIRVKEIKLAIYIRILLCMIPTVIAMPFFTNWLYHLDFAGRNLVYMRLPQFIVMFLMLLVVVMRVIKKHVANLFSENVRKALRGDNE